MLVVTIRGRGWRNQNFPGLKRANDSAWGSTFLHNVRWVARRSILRDFFHPKIQCLWIKTPNWFHKVIIAANRSPLHPRGTSRVSLGHQLLKISCIAREKYNKMHHVVNFDHTPSPSYAYRFMISTESVGKFCLLCQTMKGIIFFKFYEWLWSSTTLTKSFFVAFFN